MDLSINKKKKNIAMTSFNLFCSYYLKIKYQNHQRYTDNYLSDSSVGVIETGDDCQICGGFFS